MKSGNIPLISARKVNNGVKCFISEPSKIFRGGNVITLNNDGDGGAGLAYYQSVDFALDTHVTALYPKYNVLPEALLYIAACISKQHSIFGNGHPISLKRVKRLQIMLPVTSSGEPDYQYMEQYIKDMLVRKYEQYLSFVEHHMKPFV